MKKILAWTPESKFVLNGGHRHNPTFPFSFTGLWKASKMCLLHDPPPGFES